MYVDTTQYDGSCYEAANWLPIGLTRGRGRQDRFMSCEKTVKAIYVYELEPAFRELMGLEREAGFGDSGLQEDAELVDWVRNEFAQAQLGDKRLSKRLIKVAADVAARPGLSCAQTVEGNWADTMGYYRFVEHPDEDAINMETILQPHRECTIERMQACKIVLCIQDTTDLNYSKNRSCKELGVIGKNQTGTESRGLRLHSTLATDANGLPLGILRADCYAPELKPERKGMDGRFIPLEEKETYRWAEGQRDIDLVASLLPDTRVVSIADREGDFYEHFYAHSQNTSGVELLVRAQHNRSVGEDTKMFDAVQQTPVRATVKITIPARSARVKEGAREERAPRSQRDTEVEIRYMPVTLSPPKHGLSCKKPPVDAWIIHIHEPNLPNGAQDRVDWFLLTTTPIRSEQDAIQCGQWYCHRWRIEDFHRVLKSGCRVEDSRLRSAVRLKREIAIEMVIACRIMVMSLLGREVPELPAEIMFTEVEIETLRCVAKKKD